MASDHMSPGAIHTPEFEGKAPPGWEGPIRKMKQGGVKNPWALSWWMKKRGYTPGGKKHQMDASMGDAEDHNNILAEARVFDALAAQNRVPRVFMAAAEGELWATAELMK